MKRCGVDKPGYILCYRSMAICNRSVGSMSLRGPKSACYRSLELFPDPCFCYRKAYKTRVYKRAVDHFSPFAPSSPVTLRS